MDKLFILLNIIPTFLTALGFFTYYIVIDGVCSSYPDVYPRLCPLLGRIGHSARTPEMTALKAGDKFPEGVDFSWVPYTEEADSITSCGIPQTYNASKEFADKKVVLFAVPGAFTPGCSVRHLPSYIEHLNEIKGKGVDIVIVIAMNDAWVMSAWSKANGIKNDKIMFMSDSGVAFSKSIGWTRGADRTGRYAMVIDHGKIVYAENEPGGDVTVSGAEAVLSKL